MGVKIPNQHGQATFVFNVNGSTREMVFTLGYFYGIGNPDPGTHANTIRALWTAASRPFAPANMSNAWTFQGVRCTETAGGLPFLGQSLIPTLGTSVGESFPPNTATLVTKQTAQGGRKNRGRMFIPGASLGETSANSAGQITPAALALLQGFYTGVLTDMRNATLGPVVLHQDPLLIPTNVTAFVVNSLVATQRRRLRK